MPKHTDRVYGLLHASEPALGVTHIAQTLSLHRPAVYRALSALLDRAFISKVAVGKRTAYQAGSPQKIFDAFLAVEASLEQPPKPKFDMPHDIQFLEGNTCVAEVFDDVIACTPRGGTFYRYTSEKDLDLINQLLPKDYRKRRDAKKLNRLVISNPKSGKQKKPRLERFVKFMPVDDFFFEQDVIQLIYGDKVALIDITNMRAFILESRALAMFQKIIFKQFYKKL